MPQATSGYKTGLTGVPGGQAAEMWSGQPAVPDLIYNDTAMTVSRWPKKTSFSGYSFDECAHIENLSTAIIDTGTEGVCWNDPVACASKRQGKFKYECFHENYHDVISRWAVNSGTDEQPFDDIYLFGFWRFEWAEETFKLVNIDLDDREFTVRSQNSHYTITNTHYCYSGSDLGRGYANPTPRRWYAFNVPTEIGPGEYYIDRTNKKLYFYPPTALSSSSKISLTHRALTGPGSIYFQSHDVIQSEHQHYGSDPNHPNNTFKYPGWVNSPLGWDSNGGGTQSRDIMNNKDVIHSLFKLYKVKNVNIVGLTFKNCAGSAIDTQLCENINIKQCKIYNMKLDGICSQGGINVVIDSCDVHDVMMNGIVNTGGNPQTLEPANNVVTKCRIQRYGISAPSACAGVIINGVGNTASKNLFKDGARAVQLQGSKNIVEYNHFYELLKDQEDYGVVYGGGDVLTFGSKIRYNFFNTCGSRLPGGREWYNKYDTTDPFPYGCRDQQHQLSVGVYSDAYQSGWEIFGNVFYNHGLPSSLAPDGPVVQGWCVNIGGGPRNSIENNIFINSTGSQTNSAAGSFIVNPALTNFNYLYKDLEWTYLNPNNIVYQPFGYTDGPARGYNFWNYLASHGLNRWNDGVGFTTTVDITNAAYTEQAPWIAGDVKIETINGVRTFTGFKDVQQYANLKATVKNNVLINHYGFINGKSIILNMTNSNGGTYPNMDTNPPTGGFDVTNTVTFANLETFAGFTNPSTSNFKLTSNGLTKIREQIPQFTDINFDLIPSSSYVPQAYVAQTENYACNLRHYTGTVDFANPNILESIVTDPRFTTTVNPVNGKTLEQDFMDRYEYCVTKNNTTDRTIYPYYSTSWYNSAEPNAYDAFAPMFGWLYSAQPEYDMEVPPWGTSSNNAATRAWTAVLTDWGNLYYRLELFKDPLVDNGFTNVKISLDGHYPVSETEMEFMDMDNLWIEAPREDSADSMIAPHIYAELGTTAFNLYGYKINPENDDQKYKFAKLPQGVAVEGFERYTSPAWLAFLIDMKRIRGVINSSETAWQRLTPWLISKKWCVAERFRFCAANGGEYADAYWKEAVFHACLHGTLYFNYFNYDKSDTLDLHEVLDEWRENSNNSRVQPVVKTKIPVNTSVFVSGGKLLNSNRYLWRLTAKPSTSVTLRAFGSSTTRSDIPQTITLDANSRGAWLLTASSVPPIYILDEGGQQETVDLEYVTMIDTNFTTFLHKNKAMGGGANHDYGSGIGLDAQGKSISPINYLYESGQTVSLLLGANLNWMYEDNYRLDSNGQAIRVIKNITPTQSVTLCTDPCYQTAACYQSPRLVDSVFSEMMSIDGEWGPALRQNDPFPNNNGSRNYDYITINEQVFTAQPYDPNKPIDYSYDYFGNYVIESTQIPASFWVRSTTQNGRPDLAYNYDEQGTLGNSTNYSSVATGWSPVLFWTTEDGTLKWSTTIPVYSGYNLIPPTEYQSLKYKQITVGYGQVYGLTTNDTIVGWGGDGSVKRNTEFFMQQLRYMQRSGEKLHEVKIKKIAAGAGHCNVLMENGELFVFGGNEGAQLSDPNTVWTPIGLIPLPVVNDALYITNPVPYTYYKYEQDKSSYLVSFGSSENVGTSNACVPTPVGSIKYRLFRNNLLGCDIHEGTPNGRYDTPYVRGTSSYPNDTYPPTGSAAWSGLIDWSTHTGAPYDYQFSRATVGNQDSPNYSLNGSWTRSDRRLPMVQASGGTSLGYTNAAGQQIPNSLFGTSGNKYTDVVAGRTHTIALTQNGNIETWGWNWYYTITGSGPHDGSLGWNRVGAGNPNADSDSDPITKAAPYGYNTAPAVKLLKTTLGSVKAIGAGYYTNQVIKNDGSVFAWDRNEWGESLPFFNSDETAGLPTGKFKQICGSYHHTIALREDGTVVCWGENRYGECDVPASLKNVNTADCVWIGSCAYVSLALKRNGDLIAWGRVTDLKAGAVSGQKLLDEKIFLNQNSPVKHSNLSLEIKSANDAPHVRNEPGNMFKYTGFLFAPVRKDDGCADHVYFSLFQKMLENEKEMADYQYFVNNLPNVPSCVLQSSAWNNYHADEYVNGEYRPKYVLVNYEAELVDQIRSVNATGRKVLADGTKAYVTIEGQPINENLWQRVVSYVKLTRKMNHYIRQVFGNQANIAHYDMYAVPFYQDWKGGGQWYPNNGILFSQEYQVTECAYCDELLPDYPGHAVYNNLPNSEKLIWIEKAVKALQDKVFRMAKAISKMCLFENAEGEPDTLDLREDLSSLMPQIDPSNFIITGLNHYPNSVHGALATNTHKYYTCTSNGFNTTAQVESLNDAESNRSREMSIHFKEQGRVGLFNNQRSGKFFSPFVQGVCGSDVAESFYEFYSSSDPNNAGYKKSWTSFRFDAQEISTLPTTTTNPSHPAGTRIYTNKSSPKSGLRRSFALDFPIISINNDLCAKLNLNSAIKQKDEIIWSDNTTSNYVATKLNYMITATEGIYEQPRPCAQNETPHAGCRDIVNNPYVKPTIFDHTTKIRKNDYDTFQCSTNPGNSDYSPNCKNYCYANPVTPDRGAASILSILSTRKIAYELAVEYASYDDMVAVPYEDLTNDPYWTGYYGKFARFDPFITEPPATIQEASNYANYDDTTWPNIRLSETAKRVQGLSIILSFRKDGSLHKFMKNQEQTHIRDWPQPPAQFNVDRRPGVACTLPVAGGNNTYLSFTGDNQNANALWVKDTGIQKIIENYLEYNYNRGYRRFLVWVPCGYSTTYGPGYTSAITSAMKHRVYTGGIINPSEACWHGNNLPIDPATGLRIPQTVQQAQSTTLTFNENGRLNEWLTQLGAWIAAHPQADVGLYIGYAIPTLNGTPVGDIGISGDLGNGSSGQNAQSGRGWQTPNPANNAIHAQFLRNELQPWIDIGINFLAIDAGPGMFNYENGGSVSYGPNAASRQAVGDYKAWLIEEFGLKTVMAEALAIDPRAPILDEFNKVANTSYPRKTLMKIDLTEEICKGTAVPSQSEAGDPFNTVYTDDCWYNKGRERYRKLDASGKDYRTESGDPNDLVYSSGAYQYCPYLILLNGYLNQGEWNIGKENESGIGGFAGLDPNNMFSWYRRNTEIGVIVENYYLLSSELRKVYRDNFTNWQGYGRLWETSPAWHDQGLATPTAAVSSSNLIGPHDGRQHTRDSEFYNRVRNEIFAKIKNYIDRGYVYWASIGKLDGQLNKDVDQDVRTYVDAVEIDYGSYAQDEITENEQPPQRIYNTNSPNKYAADEILFENFINTSTSTDESTEG
jgi:alpha-tubulin suppressor-like RCC1 family protein